MDCQVNLKVLGQPDILSLSVPSNLEINSLKILVSDLVDIDEFPLEDIRLLYNKKELPDDAILSNLTDSNKITIFVVKNSKKPQNPPKQIFETDDLIHLRKSLLEAQRTVAKLNKSASALQKIISRSPSQNADQQLLDFVKQLRSDYPVLMNQFTIIQSHTIQEENNRLAVHQIPPINQLLDQNAASELLDKPFQSNSNVQQEEISHLNPSFHEDPLPPLIPGVNLTQEELALVMKDENFLNSPSFEPNYANEIKSDVLFDQILDVK